MALKTWVQSQVESYQRLKKWYLMPPCLTQYYKVWIKGSGSILGKKSALSYTLVVVAIEKGAFGSPLTMVANFTYFYLRLVICLHTYGFK